jgi:hypothetical protein
MLQRCYLGTEASLAVYIVDFEDPDLNNQGKSNHAA